MTYSLATIRHDGCRTPVLEVDGAFYDIAKVAPELLEPVAARGLINIFERWTEREPRLDQLATDLKTRPHPSAQVGAPRSDEFLTPLQYPTKVVLMGANYYDHMHNDAGLGDFQKSNKIPTLFFKPPTTTLVGSGKSVRYPIQSTKLDWEIELAAVIGKRGRRVSEAAALDYVAGFTIGVDLSARDWQFHEKHLVKFDLFGGKGFDDSCPVGPKIVPARFVDHANLQLRLWVNGDLKQNANTREMIWSLPEQIAAMSEHVTLEPGDLLLTGTPAGVGLATGMFLKVGDVIDAEIDGLGHLTFEIVADTEVQVEPSPLSDRTAR
jgi:2-keto-4-pentenoate hydratase/2-oxohepta-3-ene-1,7-dioic acid hydratase in catechol pathway